MKKTPAISFLIPTRNREQSLSRLLNSLHKNLPADCLTEVIVVGNESDPTPVVSKFVSESFGSLCFLYTGEKGVNKARNLALREARGDIVFFIDDDCEVQDTSFINRTLNLHRRFPNHLAVGGAYALPDEANPHDIAYWLVAQSWLNSHSVGSTPLHCFLGGHMSFKREGLLKTMQWFDESITFGGSETEWLYRLENRGVKGVYCPGLTLLHHTELNEKFLLKKAWSQGKNSHRWPKPTRSLRPYSEMLDALWLSQTDAQLEQICLALKVYRSHYSQAQRAVL